MSNKQNRSNKVLYIHNSEKIGGGNRVLLGLFDRIDRDRFEPWSLLPAEGAMEEELQKRRIPYFIQDVIDCATTGSRLSQLSAATALMIRMRNVSFAIFHAQGPLSYRIPSMLPGQAKTKKVCHLHFPAQENDNLAWAFRKRPHLMIACSQHVADSYEKMMQMTSIRASVETVYNFVDETIFCPGERSKALQEELSLDLETPIVSIIGLVSERKGHPHFLQMAKNLHERGKRLRYLVAGEDILTGGAFRNKMEQQAKALGVAEDMTFLGFRSDVLDIIRTSDVVVLPSHEEGMPMSILEVAACAKPVVAYRIPGVDEVIEDKLNGILVEENDIEGMATAVIELVDAPQLIHKMGQTARQLVEEKFALTRYARKIEKLYSTLSPCAMQES